MGYQTRREPLNSWVTGDRRAGFPPENEEAVGRPSGGLRVHEFRVGLRVLFCRALVKEHLISLKKLREHASNHLEKIRVFIAESPNENGP